MTKIRTSITIDGEIHKKALAVCKEEVRSFSGLIELTTKQYLDRRKSLKQ